MTVAVVWFRSDLRLTDNPAWAAATTAHHRVVPLFVLDPRVLAFAGRQRRDLLAAHLAALDGSLRLAGGRLRVERGDPVKVVPEVLAASGGSEVHHNADVGPYARRRDAAVAAAVPTVVHHGRTVHPVGAVRTQAGTPYRVFTPFHRAWESHPWEVWPDPGEARPTAEVGSGLPEPGPPVRAGEAGALTRLERFLQVADRYEEERDLPGADSTSRLSADLHFGTISPRTVMAAVGDGSPSRRSFVRQLAWREFFAQLLAAHPETVDTPFQTQYAALQWRDDPGDLAAWQQGRTGYPLVDAAMRQLLAEGWMPNRMRMVAASFLVKDLLIDWRLGERWFRRHLVDADLAQNVGNWQWVAGTGADAVPYFRVMHPVNQSRGFDPSGVYIRRWVPELSALDDRTIHAPWESAPDGSVAGVVLGVDYPFPLVDHAWARERVLAAFAAVRQRRR